jgi:hypothetical protein
LGEPNQVKDDWVRALFGWRLGQVTTGLAPSGGSKGHDHGHDRAHVEQLPAREIDIAITTLLLCVR